VIGWLLKVVPWWGYVAAGALAVTLLTGYHLSAISQAKKAGIAQDKARSDGVIAKMVTQHSEALGAANAKTDATSAMFEKVKQGAQDALRTANAANAKIRAAFAAVVGERDQLRDERARSAIVTGGVQASDDTVTACRERTERTWLSLEKALRTSRECAGDASNSDEGIRSLLRAWPNPIVAEAP
jgi:hypothetical protein